MDVAERADEKADEERLADEGEEHDGADGDRVLDGESRVEQHADADEEEETENVADGNDLAEGLVAELRFAEDESGDEGAEREGEAGQPRRVADPHSDGDDGDEKELARTPGEDEAEELGQEPRAQDDDGAKEQDGDPDGAAEAGEKTSGVRRVAGEPRASGRQRGPAQRAGRS